MVAESTYTRSADEIPLEDLARAFWRYRILIALLVIGCTVGAYVAAKIVPKQYTATAMAAPVPDRAIRHRGELESLSDNIAQFAGLSLESTPREAEAVAILDSDALAREFIRLNNLLPILYADRWDAAHSRWRTTAASHVPTLADASAYFKKYVVKVRTDTKTQMVSVIVIWTDPVQAAAWANGLIDLANDADRELAIGASERDIGYLTGAIDATVEVGPRRVAYSLIESEISKAVVARGNRDYAFKIIDPAVPPERYSRPAKMLWLATAAATGLSVSLLIVFCLVAWRKH